MCLPSSRLPDADLIFFFTHTELNDLVRGSATGGLVAKAVRRRRIHPQLDELVFPEISLGVPRPVEDSAKDDQVPLALACAALARLLTVTCGTLFEFG